MGLRSEFINFDEFSDSELHELREEDVEADLHSVESITNTAVTAFYGIIDDLTVGFRIAESLNGDQVEPDYRIVGGLAYGF